MAVSYTQGLFQPNLVEFILSPSSTIPPVWYHLQTREGGTPSHPILLNNTIEEFHKISSSAGQSLKDTAQSFQSFGGIYLLIELGCQWHALAFKKYL